MRYSPNARLDAKQVQDKRGKSKNVNTEIKFSQRAGNDPGPLVKPTRASGLKAGDVRAVENLNAERASRQNIDSYNRVSEERGTVLKARQEAARRKLKDLGTSSGTRAKTKSTKGL